MHRLLLIILLLLTLPACQRPPMAMPTMFEAGIVQPLADTPAAWQQHERRVFFVTDRQFVPDDDGVGTFNHRRSDAMALGHLQISLGEEDAWPRFAAAVHAQPDGQRPRLTMAQIERYGQNTRWDPVPISPSNPITNQAPAPDRRFISELQSALRTSPGKAITLYIHGFKNSFQEAAFTTAELSLYSGGLGPFVVYSWPSYNSLFEYSHDRDSVRYTTAHARRFVAFLADEINADNLDATQINLIAHSSGAELAGAVLRELGLVSQDQTPEQRQARWRIGTVLLVAPDISTDVVRERILQEDLRGVYQKLVIYSSQRDTALRLASRVLYRTTRIGSVRERQLTEADRYWLDQANPVTLINIDDQPNDDPVKHSHHRHSGATLSDMLLCLRTDLPPQERGLIREPGKLIWQFADDYPSRVTEAAKKTYPPRTQ